MQQKNTNITGRARHLCQGNRGDGPVIYWMERDQRIDDNWALLYAQQEALIRSKPLHIVTFPPSGQAPCSSRQLDFLMSGLLETNDRACKKNIGFTVLHGQSDSVLLHVMKQLDCHLLVTDFSPLRHKLHALHRICQFSTTPVVEVDSHNIIPAWVVSPKKEYAAYTLRPKVHRLLHDYLTDFPKVQDHPHQSSSIAAVLLPHAIHLCQTKESIAPGAYTPGTSAAIQCLHDFIGQKLQLYDGQRNDPNVAAQSGLSPYLHFGQLAPQRAALEVSSAAAEQSARDAFLEEIIVRRELSDNFCLYEPYYDAFAGFPAWARKTLDQHRADPRPYTYSLAQLEEGESHEPLWNKCQFDLVKSGKLHGFLRMYWAKKILEWTASPEDALTTAIHLNDTYSLDGGDPNGYAGIAWSIGGVHDRAWQEREIFGKIRFMNERGCRRKFKVDEYVTGITKSRQA
ncbi:MAG: deoxyribodipyrimidine photo-lyase [Desulfopila sp.]